MIVYTPLNLPKLEPDNWDVFWNIWNTHSDFAIKKKINHNASPTAVGTSGVWRGLDIYKKANLPTAWECPFFDIRNDLPIMFNTIQQLDIKSIYLVRLLQSLEDIPSHSDDNTNTWKVRSFLHRTSSEPQWYFTKPKDTVRVCIRLPESTSWFAYNDKYSWHGSEYDPGHKKIIVQLFFLGSITPLIESNVKLYKEYLIDF